MKQGVNVLLATLEFSPPATEPDPSWVVRVPCPIKYHYKNNPMAVPFHVTAFFDELFKNFKPDLIHTHHPFLLGSAALKLAHKHNIPIIFTYHTMYEEYAHYIPLPEKMVRAVVHQWVQTFCGSVFGIIVPSSAIKDSLVAAGISCPMRVIPSGLSSDFLALAMSPLKKERASSCRLLVVSRFVSEKNIPLIMRVFSQLPEHYHLTLVGFGAEYENLRTLAYQTLQLPEKRVQFVVKPPRAQLLEEYKKADLFLFSSHTDTQALVLAEAMAAGLPIIAVDGPGQRDSIENGGNGFIVGSEQEMKECIEKVWADKTLLDTLSANAKKKAQHYDITHIAAHVIEFYRSVRSAYVKTSADRPE
jgi:glycosyltransferase involved in cell wall biosynthesis